MNRLKLSTLLNNAFRWKKTKRSRNSAAKSGAAAITALILLGGSLAVLSYVVASTRMTADAAQLKHATDAAAMATAVAHAKDTTTDAQEMAERYVHANLGLDDEQLQSQLEITVEPYTYEDYDGFRVSATFRADTDMLGGTPQPVTVSSAAVAVYNPTEISMLLPNTMDQDTSELNALHELAYAFAEQMIEDKPDRWLALVPYSDIVNVYDKNHPNRIKEWAEPGALTPVELTSLFSSGIASDLASRSIPNQQVDKLTVYRGVHPGEDYNWTESPVSGFKIRYRPAYVPWKNYPGEPYIHWMGPNPFFGKATGDIDNRYIVADFGAPGALLPLTNDMEAIESNLSKMETGMNINYTMAMGWGAMALAPSFRGSSGWGDEDHPLDFSEEGSTNLKVVVMLANTTRNSFDSNYYNLDVGEGTQDLDELPDDGVNDDDDDSDTIDNQDEDDGGEGVTPSDIAERFQSLCESYQEHDIKFYFIGIRDPTSYGGTSFKELAYPGLLTCADSPDNIIFIDKATFAEAEDDIKNKLEQIAAAIESQSNYARLVE